MELTVSPNSLFILCFHLPSGGGGNIGRNVYSTRKDADLALERHRKQRQLGFTSGKELETAADDVFYGVGWSEGTRCEDTEIHRQAWIDENTWERETSCLPPHIEERWYVHGYSCWVLELSHILPSKQGRADQTRAAKEQFFNTHVGTRK